MEHDVNNLRKADGVRPDPSQIINVEMQQEWFRNLLLCTVLFFILCLMAVFMYLGTFDSVLKDNPDSRQVSTDGPAFVMTDEMIEIEFN